MSFLQNVSVEHETQGTKAGVRKKDAKENCSGAGRSYVVSADFCRFSRDASGFDGISSEEIGLWKSLRLCQYDV
jgi:hypothetical protein